ncbi:energy-coupling factor transport system ATP-binding protein [Amphibacillus marinus]|uniref:Energy-coupling factor transport system ATP-binding protein n=1 Tax=Amphibacillus marinus TaxID=872970 RepID=A0A1H8PLH1_9BACI|nr:ABC transporter ATP-binding protein [Amphibacillus marinus]SEO42755.1 energy-coupling factor transport system ATP-binding protein [Amphibacillus marinus]
MTTPIIAFNHFSFKYYSQVEPTLTNINLTIAKGEKVLILGPSGSGKSTLAHCLNGLIPFSYTGEITGTLHINGQQTDQLDLFSLSKMVGTVLQDTDGQFIGLSVAEDIAFALENENVNQEKMELRVAEIAKLVEMEPYQDSAIHALSGGQKQRVSIGGVMVAEEVDLLLFDEPLASLDPATGHYAMQLIADIHSQTNKTMIVIEHRLEDALQLQFDRIIVMNEGEIISDSTPNQLLASNKLEQIYIREPLYTKALKYAGSNIEANQQPEQIEHLVLSEQDKRNLQYWSSHSSVEPVTIVEPRNPLLELRDVSFYYQEKQIFSQVSFSIYQGELISLVGRNGAGKSTLAKAICGFEPIDHGEILFNGTRFDNQSISERANHVGFVLQNPNQMFSKHKIYDEIALGLVLRQVSEQEIRTRVEDVLHICGLYPFRNWPISALSYGQKKRVSIAAILVLNPRLLILDEPTAGQDLRHYTEIMDFLCTLNEQGITIILITHDMHVMLEYTTRSLVLTDGQLIADQSPVDVLTNDTIIERAQLRRTSLFDLAIKAGIEAPAHFIKNFITHDREVRRTWQ